MAEAGNGSANETQLWHGTPTLANVTSIVTNGFDFRLSSLAGSLGTGVYLAGSASYSHAYSTRGAFNAAAGLWASGSGVGGGVVPYAATAAAVVNKINALAAVGSGKGKAKKAKKQGETS